MLQHQSYCYLHCKGLEISFKKFTGETLGLNISISIKKVKKTENNYYRSGLKMFKNKKLLISGGTGSFGKAVLDRFLNTDIA